LDALTTGGSGEPARRGVSRTFVAGLFAALLGFGATALLVARRPAPDTLAPEPSASAAFTLAPSAQAERTPAEPAPAPRALAPVAASSVAPPASAPPAASQRRNHPSATPKPSSERARKAKSRGDGVANSLELSTREP
jgi:hypothetical protein